MVIRAWTLVENDLNDDRRSTCHGEVPVDAWAILNTCNVILARVVRNSDLANHPAPPGRRCSHWLGLAGEGQRECPQGDFEPLISTLKGWRPRPLDDGGRHRRVYRQCRPDPACARRTYGPSKARSAALLCGQRTPRPMKGDRLRRVAVRRTRRAFGATAAARARVSRQSGCRGRSRPPARRPRP